MLANGPTSEKISFKKKGPLSEQHQRELALIYTFQWKMKTWTHNWRNPIDKSSNIIDELARDFITLKFLLQISLLKLKLAIL